jgi:hypothetical protein
MKKKIIQSAPFGPVVVLYGTSGEIVRMVSAGKLNLLYDFRMLLEYHEVLNRSKFQFDKGQVDLLVDFIIKKNGQVASTSPLRKDLPDPDLLRAMARLIIRASENTQIWIVTHAGHLVRALTEYPDCHSIQLEKRYGQTQIVDQGLLDEPPWHWPD